MFISQIHIRSFRHIENVHISPFAEPPASSDLVVLAGPNGGGKSSVLELLGYALSNAWSLNWSLYRTFPTNAFEVAIGITRDERRLVREYLASALDRYSDEVLEYIENHGVYYRAYNYAEGEYQRNANLYNQIHNLITSALRNHYQRSLGFFLNSDRHYPQRGFNRNSIFEYEQKTQRDWIWGMAFQNSEIQYSDMYEFLVQQRYHFFRRLGAYHHRRGVEAAAAEAPPSDPLQPYDELLQVLFPGYRFADANEDVPTNLFIQIPSGDTIAFSDLSSGEKEVFFILSFFLRHNVSNAVIVIDEPELHLHPELARLLIRTMQSIRPGNQIWLATHNAEIIDEAGRDRVIYVTRNPDTRKAVITSGKDEADVIAKLRDLFGYSGYIGIAKNLAFLEGIDSSSDRKVFVSLFPQYSRDIKFVPAQSAENLPRLNAAILSILESNLGWIRFYLIRDHDYLPDEIARHYVEHASGRLYVLNRHHIENYLLDDEIIAKVQTDIFGRATSADNVRSTFSRIARGIAGEVLRDMVAYRLNLVYRPQDFSLGRIFQGRPFLDNVGRWDGAIVEEFHRQLATRVSDTNNGLLQQTDTAALQRLVMECQRVVTDAIDNDQNGWRVVFPGRRLLEEYARTEQLGKAIVLQNSIIKELGNSPEKIPNELQRTIEIVATGGTFAGLGPAA